jgi:hypothetical protein
LSQDRYRVLGKKEPNTHRKFKDKSMSQEEITTTARKCFECASLSIQDSFKLNRDIGLAICRKKPEPVALNWNRPCGDFEPAPEASILKRRKWRDA